MSAHEPASPACLAHEADDAYMGFATREEIARFFRELDVAPASAKAEMLRTMLPKIRDVTLHAELTRCLAKINSEESKA